MHNAERHCNRHQKVGEKQENNQGFYNSESQWEKCISLGSMTSNLNNEQVFKITFYLRKNGNKDVTAF